MKVHNKMTISFHEKIEQLAKNSKRSTKLIANFLDGYADGWHMAVRESFRPQLDIKFTSRVQEKLNDIKKAEKRHVKVWTQGPRIAFDKGHIFFDTRLGYEKWDRALKHINRACIVIEAKPNDVKKKKTNNNKGQNELIHGFVEIELLTPNRERTKLISEDLYKMSQNEFVEFLISGNLKRS
jgi:hypothetical protein